MKKIIVLFFIVYILAYNFNINAQYGGVSKVNYKEPGTIKKEYYSDLKQGIIGSYDEMFGDIAHDNVFTIQISDSIHPQDKIYLVYDLYGVSDCTGVNRSINEEFATGGYMQKKDTLWHEQKERIPASLLKRGANSIVFNAGTGAYPYQLKNVRIVIENDIHTNQNNGMYIHFNGKAVMSSDKQMYIKGFIENVDKQVKITANSQEIFFNGSEFEGIIPQATQVILTITDTNNQLIAEKTFDINRYINADKIIEKIEPVIYKSFDVTACASQKIYYKKAGLQIPDSTLSVQKKIIIAPLRAIDIAPLESSMTNVTAHNGYRFLPDGTVFDKNILISIPYDPELIPSGYTAKDIHSFYFDKQKKKWILLKKKEIDEKNHVVISYTNHFTDYINGLIKIPESPETASFTPSMMSDIKAASPLEGLTIISPPTASQKGDAQITYPIKIPAGRNGMQPSLSLHYSSNAGNGVLGEGWTLNIPAITLDTRWGIPIFDGQKETEMYMLNGEALMYPKMDYDNQSQDYMPNRPLFYTDGQGVHPDTENRQTRSYNTDNNIKIFYLRKQNAQIKIERIGDSPQNYYWKVTGSDGTISWYGWDETNLTQQDHYVIKNDNGNIVHWALVKQQDVYGNIIKYHYEEVTFSNTFNNLYGGKNFKIKKITYTGNINGQPEGNYAVEFEYSQNREDINISFRNGYKNIQPYLMTTILVKYNNNIIRTYQLNYEQGDFFKTLLKEISVSDSNGKIFDKNEFQYYEIVPDSKLINYQPVQVTFSVNPTYFLDTILGDVDSKTGVNESFDYGGKLRFLLGFELINISKHSTKHLSIDFNVGYNYLKSQGKVAFFDINGDGLKDLVFYNNNNNNPKLYFFKCNQVDETNIEYEIGNNSTVINLSNFLKSEGIRISGGLEVSFQLSDSKAILALSIAKTNSKKYIYITDGNGDGLPDIVKPDADGNSVVYFNHINENGNVVFEPTSINTENVIATGSVLSIDEAPEDVIILPDSLQTLYNNLKIPNYNMVRTWVAPKNGYITIRDTLNFLGTGTDYVDYSIETVEYTNTVNDPDPNDDFEYFPISNPFRIFYRRFDANNPYYELDLSSVNANSVPLGPNYDLPKIYVKKGQMIFFRIHSNTDNNEILQTNPYIFYEEDRIVLYSNYADSFILNDPNGYNIQENQTIHFSCDEIQTPTNFINLLNNYSLKYIINLKDIIVSTNSSVQQYTIFEKSINNTSQDNMNLNNIFDWNTGLSISGVNLNITANEKSISFSNVNDQHQYKLEFIVKLVDNATGNEILIYDDTNVNWNKIQWRINLDIDYPNGTNKIINQVANHLFSKMPLFPSYYGNNRYLNYNFLGGLYGGWGEFLYADNFEDILDDSYRDNIGKLINHNLVYNYLNIEINTSSSAQSVADFVNNQMGQWQNDLNGIDLNSESSVYNYLMNINSQYDFNLLTCYPALPYRTNIPNTTNAYDERWTGTNIAQYSKPKEMKNVSPEESITSLGDLNEYVESLQPESPCMQFDTDYGMLATKEEQSNVSLNLVGGYANINNSWAHVIGKYSYIKSMFIDLNGDRYPDIIKGNTEEGFAYMTDMNGAHTDKNTNWEQVLTYNKSDILDASISSNGQLWGTTTAGSNKLHEGDKKGNPITKMGLTNTNINFYDNNYNAEFWLDINGDGLPDKIIKTDYNYNNSEFKVKFNNGIDYNFLDSTNLYDFEYMNSSKTNSNVLSASYSLTINDMLPANIREKLEDLGVSASIGGAHSTSSPEIFYADVNGDGLIDLIEKNSNMYAARINLGNKFSNPYALNFAYIPYIHQDKNKSVSLGANYTYMNGYAIIYIFGIPVLNFKYGASATLTFSRSESNNYMSFVDINSDGAMDIVDNATGIIYLSNLSLSNKLSIVTNKITKTSFSLKYKKFQANYNNPNQTIVLDEISQFDGLNIEDANNIDCDGADTYVTRFDYKNPHYDRRERQFYGFETVKTLSGKMDPNGTFQIKSKQIDKYYNNSYFLNGLLRESYLTNASESIIYSKTVNLYKLKEVDEDGKLSNDIADFETYDVGGSEGRRQAAVLLAESFTDINDNNNSAGKFLRKKQKFEYDEFGRVIKVIAFKDYPGQMGNPADYNPFDEVITEISYDNNQVLTDKNILNTPKELIVRVNGEIVRKRKSEYDNNGNPVEIKSYFDNTNSLSTTMEYYMDGNLKKITYPTGMYFKYTYDSVEHKYITRTDDAFGYYSTAEYDYRFDKPLLITDITQNSTAYGYDDAGRLKYVIGPKHYNQNSTSPIYTIEFEYFPHGYNNCDSTQGTPYCTPLAITRHYDVQHPGNTIDTYTFTDGLGRVMQVKKDIEIDGVEKLTATGKNIYDDYGRITQTYHPILQDLTPNNQYEVNFDNSEPYFVQYTYDAIDRKIEVTDEAGITTHFEYGITNIDVLGTQKIATFVRTITPQNSSVDIKAVTYKNIDGNVLATEVKHDNQSIWTYFQYNPIGEKLRYVDNQNIQTTYQYDLLGRVTQVQSPDYGRIINHYDGVTGNLTKVQNEKLLANNQYIYYEYDWGRLISIIFPQVNGQDNVANVYYKYGSSGNQTGRLIYQRDATGMQFFKYGVMGEIVKIKRHIILPNAEEAIFSTSFGYDSWNRIQSIRYPDGEKVNYAYDRGGNLIKIKGDMIYIEDIDYDKYEQKTRILYGNGVETTYNYDPQLRRLQQMNTVHAGDEYLNINYTYDFAGNITAVNNQAPAWQNITAPYQHSYQYDDMNRLVFASGGVEINNQNQVDYELNMDYNSTYGITNKNQSIIETNGPTTSTSTYNRNYSYFNNTHRLHKIEEAGTTMLVYDYDLNGNISQIDHIQDNSYDKQMYWDEVNRLRVVDNASGYHYYLYDAPGERIIKADIDNINIAINGQPINNGNIYIDGFKLYPSAYLVVNEHKNYTKHYFAGTQRILSRVIKDPDIFYVKTKTNEDSKKLIILQQQDMKRYIPNRTITFTPYEPAANTVKSAPAAPENLYYFHPNHLGSGTLITNGAGEPHQYFVNLPYGETLYEKSQNFDYDNPYKFNGKELDQETGLYYYGARYYEPETSIWLSVDPLASERAWASPYNFVQSNPLNRIDPNGMLDGDYYGRDGRYLGTDGKDDNKVYVADNVTKNSKGIVTNATNSQELSITHSEFQIISKIIKLEGLSLVMDEYLWIAHTANNKAKSSGKSMYELLMTGYSSVSQSKKTPLSTSNNSVKAKYARSALIDVLLGNPDPTGGATYWSGSDLIAKGEKNSKFRQYRSIIIPTDILYHHLNMTINYNPLYHNGIKYGNTVYQVPASIFFGKNFNPLYGSAISTGVSRNEPALYATGAKGLTIFWKTLK